MALDSRFVIASDLQSLFRDKDSGLPLRNGVIYFWQDAARSVPKNVYKLSGSPPNYTYTNIGAVINLTSSGTISDNENPANDIILYYFPYEGTPDISDGMVELYYVEVYSEGGKTTGVLQFTREAWPNIGTTAGATQNLQNYIPNGQFKIHSDVEVDPNDTTAIPGQISQATTILAQGGWTFDRPPMTTAKDIVLFNSFGGYVSNPTASPTYYINIQNQSPVAGDGFKDLRIKFDDVNKFASDTDTYTFAFTGESNSGSLNVSLILIKHYGSDPDEEIALGNFTITNSFSIVQKSGFTFGANTGKVIGAGNYIQLALRFPTGSLFSVNLTDFILTPGNVTVTQFPQTTDREFEYQSITPAIPAYDSSDLYLPVRLGAQGLVYDHSEIGEVVSESNLSVYVNSLHPNSNKLLADGKQYETAAYSPLGIPFSRLQAEYWNSTLLAPIYGTGASYFIAAINPGITSQLIISNNSAAIVTAAADGTPATGFTFQNTFVGQSAHFDCLSYLVPANGFFILNREAGVVTASAAGSSGYSVTTDQTGNGFLPQLSAIGPIAPTSAGTYFTFDVWTGGGDFGYYVWYQVDGMGADPAVAMRTGIKINLTTGDSPQAISIKTSFALNTAGQVTSITTVAASAIPAGAYFTINSSADEYYVWYKKDGMGTDPKPSGKKPILVQIAGTDTAAQVASKTQAAINMKFFAVPDYRGYFLRGLGDITNFLSDDTAARSSFVPGVIGNVLGTFQLDSLKSHFHDFNLITTGTGMLAVGTDSSIVSTVEPTTATGAYEVRPFNKNVNYAIRY
jgi:hypothetical protein